MASFNRVILLGNLTRDVELRHTPGNQPVANFGIATSRRWRDSSGELREETTFVDCEAWGRIAETMSQYLRKGRPVLIEGRLRLDQWEKEGQRFSRLRVVVENFQFVDARGPGVENAAGGDEPPATPRTRAGSREAAKRQNAAESRAESEAPPEDDIPF